MTFDEMQDRVRALCELEGWSNAVPPAYIPSIVNRALEQFSFEAEYRRDEYSFGTVAGTATYSLVTTSEVASWKLLQDVLLDDVAVAMSDETTTRLANSAWLAASSGYPMAWWLEDPRTLRLYPAPDAVYTVRLYGVRAEEPLVDDTDAPLAHSVYHDAICRLSAAIAGEPYAITEAQLGKIAAWRTGAMQAARELRGTMLEGRQDTLQSTRYLRGATKVWQG